MSAEEKITTSEDILTRLKNYMNDPVYKETVENSSSYNERLVKERKTRLPFLDAQTGVAQSDCYIWSNKLDRMPGYYSAQLYSYPARRWRKKRRQYLLNHQNNYNSAKEAEHSQSGENVSALTNETNSNVNSNAGPSNFGLGLPNSAPSVAQNGQNGIGGSVGGVGPGNSTLNETFEDSKDSWLRDFDDGSDLPDAGELDDPESDFDDYEEYSARKKKPRRKESTKKKREYTDAEKPYQCDLCGARYKTRPGLSYHYSHSHQDSGNNNNHSTNGISEEETQQQYNNSNATSTNSNNSNVHKNASNSYPSSGTVFGPSPGPGNGALNNVNSTLHPVANHAHPSHLSTMSLPPPPLPPNSSNISSNTSNPAPTTSITTTITNNNSSNSNNFNSNSQPSTPSTQTNSNHMQNNNNSSTKPLPNSSSDDKEKTKDPRNRGAASPQTYCDFCLGDTTENKKTNTAEELVSCSDCGRSAHPTCLQFTANMILSVKKYRWQCIECKSCGLCGTSDNDDQLLFCDDCDRGYHMYCLKPPLSAPPEGSWSCHLCIIEYHTPKSDAPK